MIVVYLLIFFSRKIWVFFVRMKELIIKKDKKLKNKRRFCMLFLVLLHIIHFFAYKNSLVYQPFTSESFFCSVL